MELSKAQKEVILKMREGWTMESTGWNDVVTNGTDQIAVRYFTTRGLINLGLISADMKLTELGKTITLTHDRK